MTHRSPATSASAPGPTPPPAAPATAPPPPARTVRRSLRALADGSASETSVSDPESVVADAEAAVDCAREAASYVADGRLRRLDAAVGAAESRGASDLARRGRRARRILRRLRAAMVGSPDGTGAVDAADADTDSDRDHFRPARGTVLGRSGQRPPR